MTCFIAVSGKTVTFFPMPDDMYLQVLSPHVCQNMAEGLLAMWKGIRENGCESDGAVVSRQVGLADTRLANLQTTAPPLSTKATVCSTVLRPTSSTLSETTRPPSTSSSPD